MSCKLFSKYEQKIWEKYFIYVFLGQIVIYWANDYPITIYRQLLMKHSIYVALHLPTFSFAYRNIFDLEKTSTKFYLHNFCLPGRNYMSLKN